ncbi:MAG: shikimate kinase [Pseudomonadota bacterium]
MPVMKFNKNIVLVGFMGTGKTEVGKTLARDFSREFIDTDDVIEKKLGCTVPEIFEKYGEGYFRDKEREVVKELSMLHGLVIATGGGVVINPENIHDLKSNGVVICLTATPEAIFSRIRGDNYRPLISTPGKLEKIKELLESRKAFYARADAVIDTTDRGVLEVVSEIKGILSASI